MSGAAELGAVLLALALFAGLGWPLTRCLPLSSRLQGLGAAPVLGFGWFGIAATLLYRAGLPPSSAWAVMLASPYGWASLVQAIRSGKAEAREVRLLAAAISGVVVLLLLPSWLGGLQFALYQGNISDERNYVAASVAYKLHPYSELDPSGHPDPLAPPPALRTALGDFARVNLLFRPTVAIACAALDPLLPGLVTTGSYAYRVLMLSLWFAAAAFALRAVLRAGPGLTILVSAALPLGFFGQYVLDIDAWSELAGVPLALTALAAAAVLLLPEPAAPAGPWRTAVVVMGVIAPAAFYYPEVLPPYGAAVPVLLVLAWRWHQHSAPRAALVRGLLLGLAASLVWCGLYWHGTVDFLYRQVTNPHPRPDWYLYFQRYLWGRDSAEWRTNGTWNAYGLISAPVDLVAGALGLFFALPPPTLSLAWRMAAKAALAVLLAALVLCATRALLAFLREGRSSRGAFLLSALACCATPVPLVLMDRLWQAGKVLSMITPLLLLVLVTPLIGRRRPGTSSVAALLLVLAHFGIGLYRPVAARQTDGIHYPPPYPSALQPSLKKIVSWDLERWRERLSNCGLVNVNVGNPVVYAYAEMLLSEAGIPWVPARPIVSYYDERTLAPEDRERSRAADCQVLDSLSSSDARPGGSRFVWVGRLRSQMLAVGDPDGWVTSEGLTLLGSTPIVRARPIVELRGRTNFSYLRRIPVVTAEVLLPGRPGKETKATLWRPPGSHHKYRIVVEVDPKDLPDQTALQIHVAFDTWFVPKELGINGDTRRLVIRTPDEILLRAR